MKELVVYLLIYGFLGSFIGSVFSTILYIVIKKVFPKKYKFRLFKPQAFTVFIFPLPLLLLWTNGNPAKIIYIFGLMTGAVFVYIILIRSKTNLW